MAEVFGLCRLCDKYDRLIESHIMSSAAYARVLDGAADEPREKQLVMVTATYSILTNKHMKEYLLCRACEDRFGRWEAYAYPMLSQRDTSFPWLEAARPFFREFADSSRVDVEKLTRFAASLFWRFSVYRDSKMSLGPNEPSFRGFLLGRDPFPSDARLTVTLYSGLTVGRVDQSFSTFTTAHEDGYEINTLAMFGVKMKLFVGRYVPKDLERLCFARTGQLLIRPADDFAMEIGPHVLASSPKGKLARLHASPH
jgi:hypothetical protein